MPACLPACLLACFLACLPAGTTGHGRISSHRAINCGMNDPPQRMRLAKKINESSTSGEALSACQLQGGNGCSCSRDRRQQASLTLARKSSCIMVEDKGDDDREVRGIFKVCHFNLNLSVQNTPRVLHLAVPHVTNNPPPRSSQSCGNRFTCVGRGSPLGDPVHVPKQKILVQVVLFVCASHPGFASKIHLKDAATPRQKRDSPMACSGENSTVPGT